MKLPFTEKDLADNFPPELVRRGKASAKRGSVKECVISTDNTKLRATIQESETAAMQVQVSITQDAEGLWIDGTCTCRVGFNCKHVTAALWHVLMAPSVETSPVAATTETRAHLIYLLFQKTIEGQVVLYVEPVVVLLLKNNAYGKPKPLAFFSEEERSAWWTPVDQQLFHWLTFAKQQYTRTMPEGYPLTGRNGVLLLTQLLETGRCHWGAPNNPVLVRGETRPGKLEWFTEPDGLQRLRCQMSGGETVIAAPLTPPWYIDYTHSTCGPLETGMDPSLAAALLSTPPLKPEQVRTLMAEISQRAVVPVSPSKTDRSWKREREEHFDPIPQLQLLLLEVSMKPTELSSWQIFEAKLPVARLIFCYGRTQVTAEDTKTHVEHVEEATLIKIPRQFEKEQAFAQRLKNLGLTLLNEAELLQVEKNWHPQDWLIANKNEDEKLQTFSVEGIAQLRVEGWQIIVDPEYPYRLIDENNTEWYSDVEDNPGRGWFNLELGISVEGKRINLLPLILQLIEKGLPSLENPQTRLLARLPDGRYLPLPVERVRTILRVFTELYDPNVLNNKPKLTLSRWRAAELLALEQELGQKHFSWKGFDSLRELGERLRSFTGVQSVKIPAGFEAELRLYQQQGVDWLQFLREYHFSGVLADDMGLGKTVQALAHLWVEKQSGRLDLPCLIVAPTSLMTNWRMEAKRFTPGLSVLTLHGARRHVHFSEMKNYDVVLTTYPLLIRDQHMLMSEEYHVLILDEAQMIKNPRSKAAQIVRKLTARHRVCMTGTPMENHLGELWSLFHFLMPGMLGDYQQFRRVFRMPIEKLQDRERADILAKRIAPFLLRRTKKEVAQELPEKTEMIRAVELEGGQRDLYESIRVAMHQMILDVISAQGWGKSQIIVLDALLKLRQICCDPRLLKMTQAQNFEAGSAKLELLMDMLPNLIAEGRRVLLFSQFTQMLHLIETECVKYKLPYVKLTGDTKDRAKPIQQFQSGDVPLFLISLKAGGVGLNLTAADTVIHYDPWWNPAVQEQATDRAHRIGQEKAVFVYKLIAAGTVEEKILELQAKKSALISGLFVGEGGGHTEITLKELQTLFTPLEINT